MKAAALQALHELLPVIEHVAHKVKAFLHHVKPRCAHCQSSVLQGMPRWVPECRDEGF